MNWQLSTTHGMFAITALPGGSNSCRLQIDGEEVELSEASEHDGTLTFTYAGQQYRYEFARRGDKLFLAADDGAFTFSIGTGDDGAQEDESAGSLISQMPGRIVALLVEPGTPVAKGQPLLVMEAMKMEQEVAAPSAGIVEGYPHAPGERVMPGDLLVDFSPTMPAPTESA